MAASTPTCGPTDAGEGTWIPAFAGKTGGGGVYANWRATDAEEGTWIPAFAGKTGVAASTLTRGQMDAGEGTWIPAFAGKTGGGGVYANLRANGRRGGRGFRLSPERREVAASTPTGGQMDAGEGTWIPGFRRKDGRETPGLVFTWRPSDSLRGAVLCAYIGAESCGPSDSYTWATRSTVSSSKALPAI